MERSLAVDLHTLTARMDRRADRLLAGELGLSYRRFVALLSLQELGSATQRQLADRLGVTEPSVSRMAAGLAAAGLIDLRPDPGGGNRRCLTLTPDGTEAVTRSRRLLEQRFEALARRSGVPYDGYAAHTEQLLRALEGADR